MPIRKSCNILINDRVLRRRVRKANAPGQFDIIKIYSVRQCGPMQGRSQALLSSDSISHTRKTAA